MKIGIDIDEIVAEFVRGYLKIYNKKHNKNRDYEEIFSYNLWESLNITKEEAIKIADEFYNSQHFQEIELVEGAIEAINKLGEENEIFFITSRPGHIKDKTREFIMKHFSQIKSEIIHSGDFWGGLGSRTKAQICSELKLDFMIEDNKSYSQEIAKSGIKVFLMDKPWNIGVEESNNLIRVKNWEEVMNNLI